MQPPLICKNLRYVRNKARLTQKEVARLFDVSRGQVASYEKGTMPKVDYIIQFADYFSISIKSLIEKDLEQENAEITTGSKRNENILHDPKATYERETAKIIKQKDEMIESLKQQLKDKDKLIELLEEKLKGSR